MVVSVLCYFVFQKIQLDHEGENFWNLYVNYTGGNSKYSQSIYMLDIKEGNKKLRSF